MRAPMSGPDEDEVASHEHSSPKACSHVETARAPDVIAGHLTKSYGGVRGGVAGNVAG